MFSRLVLLSSLMAMLFLSTSLIAQKRDTVLTDTVRVKDSELPKHSPTKAALFSTFVPGLGQAYNRKFLKIPFIYAGIGIPAYFGIEQNQLFNEKRKAYTNRLAGDSSDKFLDAGNFYSNEGLLESMDINRRNRDLMFIISGVIYVLQIVDASVDAHLFYFNVSDDLSIYYTPTFYYSERLNKPVQGLSLNIYF